MNKYRERLTQLAEEMAETPPNWLAKRELAAALRELMSSLSATDAQADELKAVTRQLAQSAEQLRVQPEMQERPGVAVPASRGPAPRRALRVDGQGLGPGVAVAEAACGDARAPGGARGGDPRRRPALHRRRVPRSASRGRDDVRESSGGKTTRHRHRRRSWYNERCVPHRRGYCLHGPPGSGKSALVHAVASEFGLPLCALPLGRFVRGGPTLSDAISTAPPAALVAVEDADACFSLGAARRPAVATTFERLRRGNR